MRRALPRAAGLGGAVAVALLAGCTFGVDSDQARICRTALPALEPEGTRIEIVRLTSPYERAVRIDYAATPAAGVAVRRFALCRFAPAASALNRADLVGVTTDRGEIAGATVHLLKRFYIDTPEGLAAAPRPGDRTVGLPEIPGPLAYLAEQLLVGLPRTAVYGLLAASYALVFGLVGRINLAFGEIAAVGAAAAGLVAAGLTAGQLTASLSGVMAGLALAVVAGALHNALVGSAAFAAIRPDRTQASLIATIGLALAVMEYLRLAGGPVPAWVPPLWSDPIAIARAEGFVVTLTPVSLATTAVGGIAALLLVALMRRSRFGRDWRAAADDARAAALCGVDGGRLLVVTLALAGALAGLAGALVAIQFGALGFAGGFPLGLKALAAAILGGVGSVGGALLGGLAIAGFETLWSAYLPIEGRDLALFVVLIVTIVWLPDGLAGRAGHDPMGGRFRR